MHPYFRVLPVALMAAVSVGQPVTYPVTAKVPHVDHYHGTPVADPYRWLEANDSSAVKDWVEAQNAATFGFLERIPFRANVKDRLTKLWNYARVSAPVKEGNYWFYTKNDGLQNQSVLYRRSTLEGAEEVFLDPNTFSGDGTVSLAGWAFSKDGRLFAYAVSKSGSDWRDIYVMDVASRSLLPDKVEWAKFTGISWEGDGFYYSRYDAPAEGSKALVASNEFHKVYYHKLGTPQSEDRVIFEDRAHPKRNFGVSVTEDERFLFLTGFEGGSKGNPLYYRDLRRGDPAFKPIVETYDIEFNPITNVGDKILVVTNQGAPKNRIVEVDPARPEPSAWRTIVPEQPEVLDGIVAVGGKLLLVYLKDASHRAYLHRTDGMREREISLPTLGTVGFAGGKQKDTEIFYSFTSFTSPTNIYRYDLRTGTSTLHRSTEIDADLQAYETKQVFYSSKDGTKIPMFIVHRKGLKLDGTNPTLLYAYGGFNVNLLPTFSAARLVWLENGGVYAMANLRGGGEYGEEWHEAGTKLRKQNVFDDFIAAAEYLIQRRYTSAERLAIQGGSNGGLLVGAVVNQRPDLYRVALPAVGVMDMLRFHKFTIGWAWTRDYGSSDDPEQFKALLAYSPIHNVKPAAYPATLVTTADHDDRVVPAHSFKYIATLQENQRGPLPVLIRIETKAGHGGGKPTSKIIEETADIYAFAWYAMGLAPAY
ncbi:MAG: prolyl oligopeptidase family serine peptidase [Bacteroidetes bacterium]|jgi:prolyl oligopeptidase|nr:prolyl oligopeptidase family serine peptidase [Bacteroidota bacterium]